MPKEYTESEITMMICFQTMRAWNFNYNRRREWVIWAARHRVCADCSAQAYSPCLNLADLRNGKQPRVNRQPHDSRIDWSRLLGGLKQRGYYKPVIEQQVRKYTKPND